MTYPNTPILKSNNRRTFIKHAAGIVSCSLLAGHGAAALAGDRMWTVGDIVDLFIKEATKNPLRDTVDTLKAGEKNTIVKGVVTTMFATIPVIRQCISLGANFIIAHEPTFYNHLDSTDWLENNETYRQKRQLLTDNGIAVWRNHDYIHAHRPDGVFSGVLDQLGWKNYTDDSSPWNVNLPESVSLSTLIDTLKTKLDINTLRYIGDENQPCKKVLFMPGAPGGQRQISAISDLKPDVAIVGELQEWETAEYIRDSRALGKDIALIVIGHIASEEAGSEYMKEWLSKNCPELKVTHIPSGNTFNFR